MLSITKVGNIAQATTYYNSPDKYYSKDGGDIGSEWNGKGAEQLGLSGNVDDENFLRLLEGRVSPEIQLGRNGSGGEIKHVPAWDFTFSAPKSVSILALVGGDERVVKAHLEANRKAMAYIEKNHALTRITEKGETKYEKVDNLTAASFTHTESRKNDPQLHTHNVIMNAVVDKDGQWRSLETLRMYEGKMMAGLIYRFELANQVKQLGYDLEITDRDKGFFEIKGVPDSLISSLSKRRKQVLESAKQRGLFDQKSLEKATVYSRDSKKTPERQALLEEWRETAVESGADLQNVIERAIDNSAPQFSEPPFVEGSESSNQIETERYQEVEGVSDWTATNYGDGRSADDEHADFESQYEAAYPTFTIESKGANLGGHILTAQSETLVSDVQLAYRVLAESEAVFNAEDLTKEVVRLRIGEETTQEDIEQVYNAMVASGELLTRASRTKFGELAFTTPHAFETERQMVSLMLSGKESRPAIADEAGIAAYIAAFEESKSAEYGSPFEFSDDQRQAIIQTATNKDLVSGIQGFAGTGKTTLLECLIGYASKEGYKVKGFAPTGSAKDTLAKETGIDAKTVDTFLFQRKRDEVSTGEVWIVDEASLINGNNVYKLIDEAQRSGAKLILLGDSKQLESVEWGKAFSVLQGFRMQTSHVTSIIRQKNAALLESVYHSIDKNWSATFEKIRDNVHKIEERDINDDYLALTPEERAKTLVIIPDNEGRSKFNHSVHDSRVETGELSANEHSISILVNANLNTAQRRDARYFSTSQHIEFQRDHEDFKAGEFWEVVSKTKETLELKNKAGEVKTLNPSALPKDSKFSLDVFTQENINVSEGETLRVTKSRKKLGLGNGDEVTVKGVNAAEGTLTVIKADGSEIALDTDKAHNIDYNYAQTAFGAQGKTVDRVMGVVESWRRNLINFRSIYVTLSRARHEAHLYVDDQEKVIKKLGKHLADKTTSLSGMSQADLIRKATQLQEQREKKSDVAGPDFKHLFADLEFVTQKLSLKQGVFSHTDLLKEVLKHTIGTYDVHDVEKGIAIMRNRGDLGLSRISGEGRKSEHFYTLPTNIRTEAQVVRHMIQGKERIAAIAGKSVVESFVKARNERAATGDCEPVTKEAAAALIKLLSNRDETILVLGTDHSGHKDLMRGVGRSLAETSGYKVRMFSTNTEGVNQLRENVRDAQNVYAHVSRIEERIALNDRVKTKKEVWVVENASQLGSDDMLRLQQTARYAGARIMLVADRSENALSWGNVPALLMQNDVSVVNLDQSLRSRNADINLATDSIALGKIDEALKHIDGMIETINAGDDHAEGKKARILALANTYLNLPKNDREKTAVVIPDYFTRNKVDALIRKGLAVEGRLKGEELTTTLYRNANLDPMEKRRAQYYKSGQVIEFESARSGAEKGEYFTVTSANPQTNMLTLTSISTGKALTLNADEIAGSRGNSVRVYHVEEKSISVGEEIRFNKTALKERLIDADKNVPTKLAGKVTGIKDNIIHLTMQNGREVRLDTNNFKHLEYGYTSNFYDLKDKRFENVVTLMESGKKHFATQAALQNVLTKSTLNLKIVTDNKGKLFDSLRHQNGFQQIALDSKKVSINKNELAQFNKTFGLGLSPVNRGLARLENAFSQAVQVARNKVMEKVAERKVEVPQPQRQKQRSL
ncbi:conjugative relaxase [Erwinia psidii]|uniref:MobF family relaxase n=1 Tax=Erwinia psidii TaxID=69224 RepID=UPI00226BADF3|nr:MobF family relaxase [Erwinia psidii]MCX8966584.1 conjugative relaxase [Erwinia psidii]